MKNLQKPLVIRIAADWFITITLVFLKFNFLKYFWFSKKRGFFCNDESLKYTFHEDTVHGGVLMAISFYIPICIILLCEIILLLAIRRQNDRGQDQKFLKSVLKLHFNITAFLSGIALHALFMFLSKMTFGRLRPYFFEVCQPYRLLDGSTCDDPKNFNIYIEDYACTYNNDSHITKSMIDQVHLSFPSGHASYIWFGMTFMIVYLQRFCKNLHQCTRIHAGLFLVVVQLLCVLLAWLIALSRIMDNKHHWSDVFVGSIMGSSIAIAVSLYVNQQLESANSCSQATKSETTTTTTLAETRLTSA